MPPENDNTDPLKQARETTSEQYGNNTTIEDVFEVPTNPRPPELVAALATTTHLTEKEAHAFTQDQFGNIASLPSEVDKETLYQQAGFDDTADYNTHKQTATEKIADAIWIYELIDAFRFPNFPDECSECGAALGGTWFGYPDEDDSDVLCADCIDADVERWP